METEAQRKQESPPGNSWRSVSLFGISANTWRDFYRSGDMFRHHHLRDDRDRTAQNNSGEEPVHTYTCQHNQNLVLAYILYLCLDLGGLFPSYVEDEDGGRNVL
jgi:hypothetical protein